MTTRMIIRTIMAIPRTIITTITIDTRTGRGNNARSGCACS